MNIVPLKHCIKCGSSKPLADFGKDKRRADGLFPYCKRCRLRHPEQSDEILKAKASGLRWCNQCKEWLPQSSFGSNRSRVDGLHTQCHKCSSVSASDYYQRNIDAKREKDRIFRANNAEKMAAKWQKYYRANTHKLILRACSKRRQYDPSKDTLTGPEWIQIIRDQNGCCAKCKRKFNSKFIPTRDHILPLIKGGYLTKENTQALCRSCNTSKGTKTVRYC